MFAAECRDLYLGFPGSFDYVRCTACGLVQLHPIPQDLASYYRSYPIHRRKHSVFSWLRRQVVGSNYASPPAARAKILDFGCGDGWYLEQLAGSGHQPIGFEVDPNHARTLSSRLNIPVYDTAAELETHHAGTIDLITMHFVLEHLPNPAGTFHLMSRLLKPGGRWYFVIPNLASKEWRLFGTKWHGFDVPRHISYLDDPHVRVLAAESSLHVMHARALGSATDFAGSLSTLLLGRYTNAAFYAALPLGIVWSWLFPGACRSYWLEKQTTSP